MSLLPLICKNQSYVHTRVYTQADTYIAEGLVADRGQLLPWRGGSEGEGGMEGGEEKQETALSFTESGGVIRGAV